MRLPKGPSSLIVDLLTCKALQLRLTRCNIHFTSLQRRKSSLALTAKLVHCGKVVHKLLHGSARA